MLNIELDLLMDIDLDLDQDLGADLELDNILDSRLAVEIMKILEPFTLTSLFLKHDLSLYSSCAFEPRCCRFSLPYKLF